MENNTEPLPLDFVHVVKMWAIFNWSYLNNVSNPLRDILWYKTLLWTDAEVDAHQKTKFWIAGSIIMLILQSNLERMFSRIVF